MRARLNCIQQLRQQTPNADSEVERPAMAPSARVRQPDHICQLVPPERVVPVAS